MKKLHLNIIIYLTFTGCLLGQTNKIIDSLRVELDKSKSDSVNVEILNDLAYYYAFQDIDTSLIYGRRALKKALGLNYFKGVTRSNLYIGNAYVHSNKYDSAHHFLNKALKIAQEHKVSQSAIYSSLGMLYKAEGNYEKAIKTYFEGIEYDEESDNEYGKFVKLINVANAYAKIENISKSIEYELLALELAKTSENQNIKFFTGTLLNNIGTSYVMLEELDKALEYFNQSLNANIKSQNKKEIARNYNNLGVIYDKKEDHTKSIELLNKALEIRQQLGDKDEQVETNMVLGTVYAKLRNNKRSQYHFNQALSIAESIDDKALISEVYLAISNSKLERKSYLDALTNFKKHISFKDSILKENNLKNINEIEIKYQTEKKDKEILQQQLSLEKSENALQKKNTQFNYMTGIAIFLLFTALLTWLIYQQRQKRKNQEILALKREQQVKTLESLMEGEEKERFRIAKELHDGINVDLSSIKYKLTSLLEQNNKVINEAVAMIDKSCEQVRAISHDLVPPSLKDFNLVDAINDFCATKNNLHKPEISFETIGDMPSISKKAEVNIFRIVQELVNNGIKHANASEIDVQLSCQTEELLLTVEDNGMGFDRSEVTSGIGLQNIQSRVDYLNATLDFTSDERGTSYVIDISTKTLP